LKKFFFAIEGDNENDIHEFHVTAFTYEQAKEKAYKKYHEKTGKIATGVCGSVEL